MNGNSKNLIFPKPRNYCLKIEMRLNQMKMKNMIVTIKMDQINPYN